ncbi:MAG TPA: MlaD family protein [Capillibacterium sp.]
MPARLETKVGLFTLLSLAILIAGLLWLSGHRLLDRHYQLEVVFTHVGGLRPGAPVQMSGVDIGRVGRVTLTPEGQVLVVLNLTPAVTLKSGAQVTINTAGLLGEKIIEIIPGTGPGKIPPGTRLAGKEPFAAEALFRETGEVIATLKRITTALDRFLTGQAVLDRLAQVTADLETISGNLAAFSGELAGADLNGLLADLRTITTRLSAINFEQGNHLLDAAAGLPALLDRFRALVAAFEPFQQELNQFLTELRADGTTAAKITNILGALEHTANNLARLSTLLTEGDPNLADLLAATEEMLTSVQEITGGLQQWVEAAAPEGSAGLFKSSMEKAGRVLNLAGEFLETYDQLNLNHRFSLAITPGDWGLTYQAKLAWNNRQFLLLGCDDLGDRNRLSLQFGLRRPPWQFRLGILHNWLGLGLDYEYRNFSLQADLWQPNRPVLDVYTQYRLSPFSLKAGLLNATSPTRQWYAGLGWDF